MPLAHIAGMPVEESLLALLPLGAAGLGALVATAAHRVRGWTHRHGDPPAAGPAGARDRRSTPAGRVPWRER